MRLPQRETKSLPCYQFQRRSPHNSPSLLLSDTIPAHVNLKLQALVKTTNMSTPTHRYSSLKQDPKKLYAQKTYIYIYAQELLTCITLFITIVNLQPTRIISQWVSQWSLEKEKLDTINWIRPYLELTNSQLTPLINLLKGDPVSP